MTELKTQPTERSVTDYLNSVEDEQKRRDCYTLLDLMQSVTGAEPVMWGDAIVGFGRYHYRGASGREGDWFVTGFAPRKRDLTVYLMSGFDAAADLLARLGKHHTGKGCLYLKRLQDVDLDVLRELVRQSVDRLTQASA